MPFSALVMIAARHVTVRKVTALPDAFRRHSDLRTQIDHRLTQAATACRGAVASKVYVPLHVASHSFAAGACRSGADAFKSAKLRKRSQSDEGIAMVMNRREATAACLSAAAGLLLSRSAASQDIYPSRPIKVIIGFAAGSGADILCRFFIARMAELSGQTVMIENRPGAISVISANMVAKAKPDGYTMWWGGNSIMVGGKYLVKDFPFDPVKDVIPAGAFFETPFVLAVGSKSPANNIAELVTLLKSKSGNRAAFTNPTGQVSTALFRIRTGTDAESVSYKTTADAIGDLTDGTLDYMVLDGTFAVGQVKTGRIRVLAATSSGRITALPDVPTMQEAGVPDYVFSPWWGAYLPVGTPQPIIDKVAGWMNAMARAPESAKFLDTLAALPVLDNPKEMAERLQRDRTVWDQLAVAAKLQPG